MKLNNKLYDVLKWLGLIFFPALAVLLATVLPVWGVDAGLIKALVITINAVGVFIGALIGVSQATIAREESLEEFYETETDEDIKDEETEGV
jgi:hypothetical protein